jgi:regulator of cell morphogenesis and NO signaling
MLATMSLGDIAEKIPAATTVLRKYHLDFCCGGSKTLTEACQFQNLEIEKILGELTELEKAAHKSVWTESSQENLIDHLENHFHARHRMMLPELKMMADKVERVHKEHNECPFGLSEFLAFLNEDLCTHMSKEENILFPMIKAGRGKEALMPIHVMKSEHDQHGQNLTKLRVLAFDFNPPENACGTWRALYKGLDQLEQELMEHIHLENHILFPRALK